VTTSRSNSKDVARSFAEATANRPRFDASSLPVTLEKMHHPKENGLNQLFLVRHGRTESNVRRLLHGSTDVPLDAYGLHPAALIAERLAREAEQEDFDVLISSPLQRAMTTARIIGEKLGMEPIINAGLSEMNFGQLEGATIERILAEHPDVAERLEARDELFAWPEGESLRGFDTRIMATFLSILQEYDDQRVIVVAHGGVIGSFLAQAMGISPLDWQTFHTANCSLTHLEVRPDQTVMHLFNDQVHLEVLCDPDESPSPMVPEASLRGITGGE
jgi:broad specificity phosphatase PhoE